ncbi:kinase-like protein [Rickenella mellea]|uniref:Kinase-like protein n=1 Tax=Rickenella mellea TaxID=50990 RepID=A0A4Y7PLJ3_9AGAM|nr:kinase-like protein [Rickenella mellea]
MSKVLLQSIEHLDLTRRVKQTEDKPRFVGGCGKVYYGELHSKSGVFNVAIKRVKASLSDDTNFAKILINELKIWSCLDDRNVLPLRGYILDDGEFPALISEWMTKGTVLAYLDRNIQVDLFDMVKGIASGLAYLHEKGVVHADLKCDNVLISPSGDPLLADFGISRTLIVTHTVTTLRELMGSVRWMAYELLAPQESDPQKIIDTTFENTITETKPAVPSIETDVWAFGMVVYELLTKQYPFAHLQPLQAIIAIVLGNLPSPPSNLQSRRKIEKSLWKLCTLCWNRNPAKRPAIKDVVREINGQQFGNALDTWAKGNTEEDVCFES